MAGPRQTAVAFDQISLHDAEVESVEVQRGRIELRVSFAGTGIVECKATRLDDDRVEFAFGGFDRGRVAWVEWKIVAATFELRWDSVLEPWR